MSADSDQTSCPVLEAARALAPRIRDAAPEIDRGRRLTPEIVQALKEAGVFGMTMPREWGGPELDPMMQMRVIEALAEADGSVGWCAMINSDGGYLQRLPRSSVAREMYRDLEAPTGSSLDVHRSRGESCWRLSRQWPLALRQRLSALRLDRTEPA